jgi:hypothetical protein
MDVETGTPVNDVTPEEIVEFAREIVALGARVLSGCYGSTP